MGDLQGDRAKRPRAGGSVIAIVPWSTVKHVVGRPGSNGKLARNPEVFGCHSAPVRHFFVLDGLALIEIGKAGSFDG